MKFLFDESADFRLIAYLRERGHDVTAIAHRERRILVADDHDFGELVFLQQRPHAGVILFRLGTTDVQTKRTRLAFVLTRYADALEHFIVLTDRSVRVRER